MTRASMISFGSACALATVTFAGSVLFVFPGAMPAAALPTQCVITTYYKTAEMVTVVGVRTNCPGGSNSGRTSPYKEREVVQLNSPGPVGGGGGGGSLPCEFLAKGCGNLPVKRFN